MARRLLSEVHPVFYYLAVKKGILQRHLQNKKRKEPFATKIMKEKLPHVLFRYSSNLIKTGPGIDPVLQENKAHNIHLSASKMNGVMIHPGEEFSFWHLVGKISKKNGYTDGRVIVNNKVVAGTGGGLCNLANTINLLVIHSPLKVTEFHTHSDALAPDVGERLPLRNGTSVSYNYVDYRFVNPTDQVIQLCIWVEGKQLIGELRSEQAIDLDYELIEEDHHFTEKNGKYYRLSKIYQVVKNKSTQDIIDKNLIWDNCSEVMFDYQLIPRELIK